MKGHNCLGHSSDLHKCPTTKNINYTKAKENFRRGPSQD